MKEAIRKQLWYKTKRQTARKAERTIIQKNYLIRIRAKDIPMLKST